MTLYDVKVPVSHNIQYLSVKIVNMNHLLITYYLYVIIRHYDVKVTMTHILLRVQA